MTYVIIALMMAVCGAVIYYLRTASDNEEQPEVQAFLVQNPQSSINATLQQYAEDLMEGYQGSIVALEPATGEVLCMAQTDSAALYPLGGIMMVAEALVMLSEGIITPQTMYDCRRGFSHGQLHVGCHAHPAPLTLTAALSTSCFGYACRAFLDMMNDRRYGSVANALDKWSDYLSSMGFGRELGTDIPQEKKGLLPNAEFLDKYYPDGWNGLSILHLAVGQGEILVTPLQLANLCATIANRGDYVVPHLTKVTQDETQNETFTTRQKTMVDSAACEALIQGVRASVERGDCRSLSQLGVEACVFCSTAMSHEYDYATFIGFAPKEHPSIAVAVYVEDDVPDNPALSLGKEIIAKYFNRNKSSSNY